jgi:hypothetical protein
MQFDLGNHGRSNETFFSFAWRSDKKSLNHCNASIVRTRVKQDMALLAVTRSKVGPASVK